MILRLLLLAAAHASASLLDDLEHSLCFETQQAWVVRMAGLLLVEPLAIFEMTKNVAITADADAQIHRPTPIIHTIHPSLEMVQ